MDNHIHGIPVAWSVTSNEKEETIELMLTALKAKMEAENPFWKPSCFVVDDASATINVIR